MGKAVGVAVRVSASTRYVNKAIDKMAALLRSASLRGVRIARCCNAAVPAYVYVRSVPFVLVVLHLLFRAIVTRQPTFIYWFFGGSRRSYSMPGLDINIIDIGF